MRSLQLLVCVWLSAVVGCVKPYQANAFDGDPPADQIARLTIDSPVRLASLDGKPVDGIPAEFKSGSDLHKPRVVNILPGPHRLVVGVSALSSQTAPPTTPGIGIGFTWKYPGSKEDEVLDFTAVAGRRYIVKIKDLPSMYDPKSDKWRARVIDSDDPQFQKEVSTSAGRVAHAFPDGGK
jgi:hypothetical protein